ncbi:hypothetical protein LR032_04310 [Candidatus Bipolaricaulota bacterium]|nr:hypothetical protein [Candidatus Bipolaricaulota bacterium]
MGLLNAYGPGGFPKLWTTLTGMSGSLAFSSITERMAKRIEEALLDDGKTPG